MGLSSLCVTVQCHMMSTGEVPDPTEVFTVLKLSETKVAFKSGYGKYLSVDMERRVVGRSEAISNREQFEPVFQEVQHCIWSWLCVIQLTGGVVVGSGGDDGGGVCVIIQVSEASWFGSFLCVVVVGGGVCVIIWVSISGWFWSFLCLVAVVVVCVIVWGSEAGWFGSWLCCGGGGSVCVCVCVCVCFGVYHVCVRERVT